MKKIIIVIIFISLIGLVFLATSPVLAYKFTDIQGLTQQTAGKTGLTQTSAQVIIGGVITSILTLVGAIFVVLIIYGGFTWMVSAESGSGDKKIHQAKKIISYAVIGLVVIVGAYTATFFISSAIERAGQASDTGQQSGITGSSPCAALGGSCKTNFACTDSGGTIRGILDCGDPEHPEKTIAICCVPPITPSPACDSCGDGIWNICDKDECEALGCSFDRTRSPKCY